MDVGLMQAVESIPTELRQIVRYPVDQPEDFAAYALAVGGLVLADKPLTQAYQQKIEARLANFSLPAPPKLFPQAISAGPDGWLVLGMSGTLLGGLIADDERAVQTGWAAIKATAYSVLVTQVVLKSITGRNRPNPALGQSPAVPPFTDNPLDGGHVHRPVMDRDPRATSFPSFHFTTYFAVAKVYQEAYDNVWLPYGLMTLGLASNIKSHHHWVSDMTAGALVGTLIGQSVHQSVHVSPRSTHARLEPLITPSGVGVALVIR
ncbi:MAG: phosphatase PAP2 family protein [Leptothrix ochracea]|uniref:phosphatase PAP2 family protein n=1 Tax=Leptothrix ochracea TaxID=735331 RepID=UPI0034E1DF9A